MLKTIKSKLLFQTILLILINIFISVYAINSMKALNVGLNLATTTELPGVVTSNDLHALVTRYRLSEYKHIISDNKTDMTAVESELNDKMNSINSAIDEYKATINDDNEQQSFDEFSTVWADYKVKSNELLALSRQMKTKEAMAIMAGDSKTDYTKIDTILSKLTEINKQSIEDTNAKGNAIYNQVLLYTESISIVLIILCLIISVYIIMSIRKPLNKLKLEIDELALRGGDLTKTIEVGTKGEIHELSISLNNFINSLKDIVSSVNDNANNIDLIIDKMKESINDLNSNIEQVSATTEELSATMQETAASAEEMSASSSEIEQSIQLIAHKTKQGLSNADKTKEKAINIKNGVQESINKSNSLYTSTKEELEQAILASKVVSEINALSEVIMEIADQTNLLSLNASIEAARAGDAGRGFTVVATEIRKLAEESKEAVASIQSVTNKVVTSVKDLSENSIKLLEFMDSDVAKDYATMLEVAEDYNKDAANTKNFMIDIDITAEQLLLSIEEVLKTIQEVANAANDGAGGTNDIANKVMEISEQSDSISEEAIKSSKSTEQLKSKISQFKI